MNTWTLTCPNCGTDNEVPPSQVTVECGRASCVCICANCGTECHDEQEYWRWLGLDEGPPHNVEVQTT